MHNFYICDRGFDLPMTWRQRIAARLLNKLRFRARILPDPDPTRQMITPEQRINLWHLAEQVLAYGVPGDFVDVGCFDGRTSAILAALLAQNSSRRTLHLFDSFEHKLGLDTDIKQSLLAHFSKLQFPLPMLHEGRFEATLPRELPDSIAFAQIDCGVGAPSDYHSALLHRCLELVWARLSPGAVCVVQDYHDPASASVAHDYYPFIKGLVDDFLAPHGVQATALFSGLYSHGYFRKPAPVRSRTDD